MNKWVQIIVLIFLGSCKTIAKDDSLTELVISPGKIDFGRIKTDTVVKGKVAILNVGNSTAKIYNILPFCGCTVVKFDQREISPKDSMIVNFEFNSNGKWGPQNRFVSVYANTKDTLQYFEIIADVTN